MNTTHDTASEQTALWNGAAGRAWVEAQQVLYRLFTPFEDLLVAAVRAASSHSVLDVGCGTGAIGSTPSCTRADGPVSISGRSTLPARLPSRTCSIT